MASYKTDLSHYKSTDRVKRLREELYKAAMEDRTNQWVRKDELEDIYEKLKKKHEAENNTEYEVDHVMIRRAYAIEEMLTKITDPTVSEHTHTYEIGYDELIVGVLPMGSNGLGKVFPNYLTEEEKRVATLSNRTELSLLGHNSLDYKELLAKGLNAKIEECETQLTKLGYNEEIEKIFDDERKYKINFYKAVKISCEAVIAYAKKFSDLAYDMANKERSAEKSSELKLIGDICKRVPAEPARTFHEALQSIYFYHVALHSSLDFISLGRLDQVLKPYLGNHSEADDVKKAVELFECFLIKAAGRLILNTDHLVEQDHMDYNAALGTHPYYLDQKAGVNNFLQNVIVGGLTPEGDDATNICTYVILQAFENVNLSTPGIYVRLRKKSHPELKKAVARSLSVTKNLPAILNDDVLIPALRSAFNEVDIYNTKLSSQVKDEYDRLVNDYCVDGCWEPILNGKSDWTFGMINGMTILECTLNQGATLDDNPNMLRGGKLSTNTGKINSFDDLEKALKKQIQFFVDQSTMSLYLYYLMDEFVNPTPLVSAFLGTCMERGRDKSFGGTKYNIGGNILIGVPNMVNTICAIRKWVFDFGKIEKDISEKYDLQFVLDAMRSGFRCVEDSDLDEKYKELHECFKNESPKFGNNDDETKYVTKLILGYYHEAIKSSKVLADKIFLKTPVDNEEMKKIRKLRAIAGYYGPSLQELFGDDFNIRFTAGCGTFEQYPLQGQGVAGCADRIRREPLAPNFSPMPGTTSNGLANVINSFEDLELSRFAAGVMTDLTLSEEYNNIGILISVIEEFLKNNGCMLTLSLGSEELYTRIYLDSVDASKGDKRAKERLKAFADVNVRVGGWQAPFISMSLDQQKSYLKRAMEF